MIVGGHSSSWLLLTTAVSSCARLTVRIRPVFYSADEDLAILFQVLDVRAPRSLRECFVFVLGGSKGCTVPTLRPTDALMPPAPDTRRSLSCLDWFLDVPLKNRDLPASFFASATPQKGAFGGSGVAQPATGMAPRQPLPPPVAMQAAAMEIGALPNIDHIFSAPTPAVASTLPTPPAILQAGGKVPAAAGGPPIDIMDILDSGALENELAMLGVQTMQTPRSTDVEAPAVPDVADDILDDLDLDF